MDDAARDDTGEIRIGISSCLLGEAVRYDGGHKREEWLAGALARCVTLVPVCPEMEIGLGAPREAMHLESGAGGTRLVTSRTRVDLTARMAEWAERRLVQLERLGLSGYILKARSPSCGLGVAVRPGPEGARGARQRRGPGIFAAALLARWDTLPVEEETRLRDPRRRAHFLARVCAHRRLAALDAGRWRLRALVELHARERLLLRVHDPAGLRALDRLVGEASRLPPAEVPERYRRGFLDALRKRATPRKAAAALAWGAQELRGVIDDAARGALEGAIDAHRRGVAPLGTPAALLAELARRHGLATLAAQSLLAPHPAERLFRDVS